jgi:hypothetical protein
MRGRSPGGGKTRSRTGFRCARRTGRGGAGFAACERVYRDDRSCRVPIVLRLHVLRLHVLRLHMLRCGDVVMPARLERGNTRVAPAGPIQDRRAWLSEYDMRVRRPDANGLGALGRRRLAVGRDAADPHPAHPRGWRVPGRDLRLELGISFPYRFRRPVAALAAARGRRGAARIVRNAHRLRGLGVRCRRQGQPDDLQHDHHGPSPEAAGYANHGSCAAQSHRSRYPIPVVPVHCGQRSVRPHPGSRPETVPSGPPGRYPLREADPTVRGGAASRPTRRGRPGHPARARCPRPSIAE